jgi:hypothetical protein
MTESLLRFVDNLGVSYGLVLLAATGFVIGSIVWFVWGAGIPKDLVFEAYGAQRMDIREFLTRVTLRSTQGRLFLVASAANIALAAAIPFLGDRIRDPAGMIWLAALWPLFLFVLHAIWFVRFGVTWFSTVILSAFALLPAWRILVADLLGIR